MVRYCSLETSLRERESERGGGRDFFFCWWKLGWGWGWDDGGRWRTREDQCWAYVALAVNPASTAANCRPAGWMSHPGPSCWRHTLWGRTLMRCTAQLIGSQCYQSSILSLNYWKIIYIRLMLYWVTAAKHSNLLQPTSIKQDCVRL